MRPEERLPTKRTASIGSRVPPAVTSTFRPSKAPPTRSTFSTAASSSGGSGSRPIPNSPGEPSDPVPGSSTVTPRARSVARFACVAGCSYIALFMAGATISGRRHASAAAVSRLSACPCASLASVCARRRRDQVYVGALDQREVRERRVIGQRVARERAAQRVRLELGDEHRRAGDARERVLADEARGRLGLDHADAVARLQGEPGELNRLVGRDAAAHTEEDARHRVGGECTLAISVRDLAARDFLERDRQVVLGRGVDHRRRELLEGPSPRLW